MTIKLSDYKREQIKKAILSKRFDKLDEKLAADKLNIGRRVYYQVFDDATRRRMRSLPNGWLPTVTEFGARLGGEDVFFEYSKDESWPVPFEKTERYRAPILIVLPAEDPLAVEWSDLKCQQREREAEEETLTREINAVLYSVTTAKRLVEVWPEIAQVVEMVCHVPSVNLPAPRVDALNKMLGLGQAA